MMVTEGVLPRSISYSTKRYTIFPALSAACLALLLFKPILAGIDGSQRFRPGIRNGTGKNRINRDRLSGVLGKLREKTGLATLHLDDAEFLVVDDPTEVSGGSMSARNLLFSAMSGDKVIELEDYSRDQSVFFANIGNQNVIRNMKTGERIEVYYLRFDFFDFSLLQGDPQALKSFDTGIVMLHELAHAVWAARDGATRLQTPGECIGYTNRIREELGYPLRKSYQPEIRQKITYDQGYIVELAFETRRHYAGRDKRNRYYVFWNSDRIGILDCRGMGVKRTRP